MVKKVVLMYNKRDAIVEETARLMDEQGIEYDEYIGFSPIKALRRDKNYIESLGEDFNGREVKLVVLNGDKVLWHNHNPEMITNFHNLNEAGNFG